MNVFLTAALISLGINITLFLVASAFQTDKFTDFAYGISFITITFWLLYQHNSVSDLQMFVSLLVVAWGVRLISYLVKRIHVIKRDKRFDGMRESFVRFLGFWTLQTVSVVAISIPVITLLSEPMMEPLYPLSIVGMGIAILGLIIETIADKQKFKFKTKPSNKGKWIQTGLWKYARHPNYFGEIVFWWGICLAVFVVIPKYYLLISPLFIMWLLLFVSGIPLLEKKQQKKYGKNKAFKKYKESTRLLVPLPLFN